ncbi:MAG: hypothetical protein JWP91_4091 [Fibrobacteres bacterium]|nr:hypothetical protein [Fibrobacterota bacterium]
MRHSNSPLRVLPWLACGLLLAGCAAVKPWEREKLASPCMQSPFAKTALEAEYQDKLVQTTTGGGLPGDAPGGGCGCVQ